MAARQGVLAAIIAFTVIAAPAEATIRKGSVTDPASDITNGGTGGHDILQAVGVSDDAGGAGAVAVRLAGTPATNAFVSGALGTLQADGTTCGAPYAIFSGYLGNRNAVWARDTAPSATQPASLTIDGTTVTLAATHSQLALPFNCAYASTRDAGNQILDETSDFPLAADPPPAATPTPTPSAPAPTPVAQPPVVASTPPVKVPAAAKLALSLSGTPSTIKRNRTMRLKLKVANDGSKTSSKVSVSIGRARGLSVGKVKTLPALKPAQKRTLTLKVKLTKRAKVSTNLKVTIKAGKLKQSSTVLLRIGKAKKLKPVPQEQAKQSPIVGTYWWRTVNHVDWAWDNRALYFVDNGTVYSGFPKGGLPTACTAPPAEPGDEFDTREGCLTYSFDEKTGAVTIGDKVGTFAGGKLTIDGEQYTPLTFAQPGQRFTINEHRHWSFQGMCGLIMGCTVTKEYLSLSPDGQFIKSRSTTSTMGDPGMGPWTAIGSYPPDQHGTYEVLAGGKIRLAYADGTVKEETFAIDTNATTGQPDALGEGVLVGETNFYPDTPD